MSATIGGRFELEREAASGASGVVYRARDLLTGAPVALKLLSTRKPGEVERFAREAGLCARLGHPAIVRYVAHGVVVPGGAPWLALDWIDGVTLAERLRQKPPLDLEDVMQLARRVAGALGEAHRAGVVHRDVTPRNLLLEGGIAGRVHLTDFGAAARVGAVGVAATRGYLAPEQGRGSPVDPRLDVYALGRVLAECIGGRPVPAAFGGLVQRLLAPDPALRPTDGDAVVAALDGLTGPGRLRDELRLASVVLVAGGSDDVVDEAARAAGARVEDQGGALALFIAPGADAPRRALALARRLPQRTVVVASGRLAESELAAQAAGALRRVPAGAIGVDEVTASLIERRFELEAAAGMLVLSGPRAEDAVRTVLGRQLPLVGRELELDLIDGTLDEWLDGPSACAVLLDGRPGSGKSRILTEVTARARRLAPGLTLLAARADPFGAGSPYALAGEIIRRAAGIHGAEAPAVRQAKLRARAGRAAPLLGELAGVWFPDDELRGLRSDAVLLGDATRGAWEDWLRAECAAGPVLMVLDDLHWGDRPSLALVDHALRALPDAPLCVVAAGRPEVHDRFPDLWGERSVRHVRLPPLSRRAALQLVASLLGADADDATVARVVDRAGGNPFFLEELVRQVAAGRGDELPATVLATVQARLEALAPDARRMLRAASVFGQAFTAAGVATLIADERPEVVASWLDELTRREVLAQRGGGGAGPAYDFAHELVREAAYAMLPHEDRAAAHLLAGEWLEWIGASDAVALAGHYERGAELERAAAWYRRGAEQALSGDDLEAAILRAELGIALVPDGEPLGGLLLVKAEALRWRGDLISAERHAALAAERLIAGSASWFHAVGERIEAAAQLGGADTVLEWAGVAAETEPLPPARSAQAVTLCRAAAQLYATGQDGAADEMLARAEALAAASGGDALLSARLARVRASRALARGDLAALATLAADARARARAAGDQRDVCLLEIEIARARAGLGDLAGSSSLLLSALAEATRMGLFQVEARARVGLAELAILRADFATARAMLARAIDYGVRQRDRRLEGAARAALARVARAEGDLAAAERESEEASLLLGQQVPP